MAEITSRQHPLVHSCREAVRRPDPLALIDGWHLLEEAVSSGIDLETAAYVEPPPGPKESALLARLASRTRVLTVSPAVMDALSPVRTPSGVVALAHRRDAAWQDLLAPAPALVVVASDVQDPGNAGAIVRVAEAAGATGVVMAGSSADPWGWKVLRAAMGSLFRLPVRRERDPAAALRTLRQEGLRVIAAVPEGVAGPAAEDLTRPCALLLGSEGAGLDPALVAAADARVTIPMRRPVESLNVAVAAALLVYEAARQRGGVNRPGET